MSNLKLTIKQLPGVKSLLHSERYGRFRHLITLRRDYRMTDKVFTRFLRLKNQFDALRTVGIDFLEECNIQQPYRILTFGCSTGAEVWSIVYTLLKRDPNMSFKISASDIREEVLAKARSYRYTLYDVSTHEFMDPKFVEFTFNEINEYFHVKDHLKIFADFSFLNILDCETMEQTEKADIIFAQNILFNMYPNDSEKAFHNIVKLLKDKSLLFIEGMDLPQRYRLTKHYNLKPLDCKIEEIHDDARVVRADGWPYSYWGLEPLSKSRKDWKHYYSTIFIKN